MSGRLATACLAFSLLGGGVAFAAAPSPYSGETAREIKALDPAIVEGLRLGAGLGYAKPAELNGYPGPAHLISLADEIPLDDAQRAAIEDIFERMRADAILLGDAYLAAERRLDEAFRDKTVSPEKLERLTAAAGDAQARLRARHLAAHLEAKALLTPEQIMRYEALRGYRDEKTDGREHRHSH